MEILKERRLVRIRKNFRQHLHAVARFLSAGFQEIKELVVFAEKLLQGNHVVVVLTERNCPVTQNNVTQLSLWCDLKAMTIHF
jgi:hypothetical protein